jgi:hypothetical protein
LGSFIEEYCDIGAKYILCKTRMQNCAFIHVLLIGKKVMSYTTNYEPKLNSIRSLIVGPREAEAGDVVEASKWPRWTISTILT